MDWYSKKLSSMSIVLSLNCLRISLFFQKKHLDESHPHPKCEFCDQQFGSMEQLNEHKLQQCDKFTIFCPLKQYGCDEPVCSFIH